jgi:predicted nucleic acid-binding protein
VNLVLDASVAAKWLLAEADSDKAAALFQAWTAKRVGLLAPELLPAEVTSALWKRVMRGFLPVGEAMRLQNEFTDLGIPLHPIGELVGVAFDLALRYRHSVYDGLYLALAHKTGAEFVTADEKLFKLASPGNIRLLRNWEQV